MPDSRVDPGMKTTAVGEKSDKKAGKMAAGNLNTKHHSGRDSCIPPLLRFLFHKDSLEVDGVLGR